MEEAAVTLASLPSDKKLSKNQRRAKAKEKRKKGEGFTVEEPSFSNSRDSAVKPPLQIPQESILKAIVAEDLPAPSTALSKKRKIVPAPQYSDELRSLIKDYGNLLIRLTVLGNPGKYNAVYSDPKYEHMTPTIESLQELMMKIESAWEPVLEQNLINTMRSRYKPISRVCNYAWPSVFQSKSIMWSSYKTTGLTFAGVTRPKSIEPIETMHVPFPNFAITNYDYKLKMFTEEEVIPFPMGVVPARGLNIVNMHQHSMYMIQVLLRQYLGMPSFYEPMALDSRLSPGSIFYVKSSYYNEESSMSLGGSEELVNTLRFDMRMGDFVSLMQRIEHDGFGIVAMDDLDGHWFVVLGRHILCGVLKGASFSQADLAFDREAIITVGLVGAFIFDKISFVATSIPFSQDSIPF